MKNRLLNKLKISTLILFLLLIAFNAQNAQMQISEASTSSITEDFLGVVLLDDIHGNDYSDDQQLLEVQEDLASMGYVPYFTSEIGSWEEALPHADYFIISTPTINFTSEELSQLTSWLENGSHNLLISSRGDFATYYTRSSINNLLSTIGSKIKVQDDNVYTTDSHNRDGNQWYVHTGNFNTTTYPSLFENMTNDIEFFSGSSISFTGSSVHPLVYGEAECFQEDFNTPDVEFVYDNTSNGVGGELIPLAGLELLNLGPEEDRVVVMSSTIWADFDYWDESHDDVILFRNIMNYFNIQTIADEGVYVGPIPDFEEPTVKIAFPRDNSVVFGTINITIEAYDKNIITEYQIFINGVSKANSSFYLWDTTGEIEGSDYNITATAIDGAGLMGRKTHNVMVDNNYVPSHNERIKILTYNIKESGNNPAWLTVIKEENPDILVLIETGDFDDNGDELLDNLLGSLNDYFIDKLPYTGYSEVGADQSWQGIAIFSRFPILQTKVITQLTLDNGNSYSVPLSFVEAKLDVNGTDVFIIGTHLTCCDGTDNEEARLKQMEGIINYMDSLGDVPIVFAGDFNSYSPEVGTTGNLGSEPIGMLLESTSSEIHDWIDVFRELNPTEDGATYPSYGERIDFIFVNQFFSDALISSTTGDTESASIGSDHLPVDVVININKIAEIDQTTDTIPAPTPAFSLLLAIGSLYLLYRKKRG